MNKGRINEVFSSIQGEGLYLGEKQIFVRFFGCNLGCGYCDTKLDSFMEYDPEELMDEIKLYSDKHHSVSFTGGEPLLQKDFLKEVLKRSRKERNINYLETNGTLPQALEEVIDYVDIVSMDIKLPSSCGTKPCWEEHRKFLKTASSREVFLKVVICESTKELDLKEGLKMIKEVDASAILVLQPNSQENKAILDEKLKKFKNICIKEKVSSCIIPQMHKIVGVK
jgi:7-carboxy-7-deazaguanine synthase